MNVDDAANAVEFLAAMTTGWNDEAAAAYVVELSNLADADALYSAVHQVAATWTDAWRPSLGVVVEAYKVAREAQARDADRGRIDRSSFVPLDRGLAIAWETYVEDCRKRNVEPRREVFGRWANSLPPPPVEEPTADELPVE